jgi:hypothetical protein
MDTEKYMQLVHRMALAPESPFVLLFQFSKSLPTDRFNRPLSDEISVKKSDEKGGILS